MQDFVSGETKALQFKVVEVGSVPGDTGLTMTLNHKGKKQVIKSKIGAKMSNNFAKSKTTAKNQKAKITGQAISVGNSVTGIIIALEVAILVAVIAILLRYKKR